MKKLYYIIFLALSLIWSACADLNEHPVGILTPDTYFTKASDGLAVVMGAYAYMASYEDYGNDFDMLIGMRDDQQKSAYSTTWNNDLILPATSTNEKNGTVWYRIYGEIGCANNAIENIPKIPDTQLSPDAKNALIAEAKVIKAFDYFRLVRMFGAIPYVDKFVTDPAAVAHLTRMPTDEVYTNIIADLEASKDLLPDTYDAGATPIRSRVSKGTAYTVLADVYLTRGDYTKAALNAKYVIDHKADFGYDLMTDFKAAFNFYAGNDCKEYVWSVDFSSTDGGYPIGRDQVAMLCGLPSWFGWDWGGWGTVYASAQSLSDFDAADYRRKVTFWEDAPMGGVVKHYNLFPNASPAVAKIYGSFVGTPSQNNAFETNLNWPVYRYAEVLLIAAEAQNEVDNGPSNAYQYINEVRGRARNYNGIPASSLVPADLSGLSKTQFKDSVIMERKRELAFEFKRWFDIKRLNLTLSNVFGPAGTDPLPDPGLITQKYLLLFIPQTEIDINPNLGLDVQ